MLFLNEHWHSLNSSGVRHRDAIKERREKAEEKKRLEEMKAKVSSTTRFELSVPNFYLRCPLRNWHAFESVKVVAKRSTIDPGLYSVLW
jgi:hypothetical protein